MRFYTLKHHGDRRFLFSDVALTLMTSAVTVTNTQHVFMPIVPSAVLS